MKSRNVQLGNPELAAELAGLPIAEVSERCSEILFTKTIPVERLEVLLDNMTRFKARSKTWGRTMSRMAAVPYEDDVIDLRDAA